MSEPLQIDAEEVSGAWLVAFGDDEGWHPSMSAGVFFTYAAALAFVEARRAAMAADGDTLHEWSILRVLPFELRVVNDFTDPENPPRLTARGEKGKGNR